MAGDDEDGFGSERDFMDALRVLKAPDPLRAATTSPPENPFSGPQIRALFFWLMLLTAIAFVMWAMMPGVPFWLVWLANIWPLPVAGLVNWLGRDGRRRRAGLSDAPAGYLRTEYRDRPAGRPAEAGRTLARLNGTGRPRDQTAMGVIGGQRALG